MSLSNPSLSQKIRLLGFYPRSCSSSSEGFEMGSDEVLRFCLATLGALMLLTGVTTFSFKKVMATYAFGILGIAGILLPDWEFFDRDYREWFSPMPLHRAPNDDRVPQIGRFKFYPLRVALITIIYSFGLYKWWMIVSS